MTKTIDTSELPIHDFENDTTISEARKEACKVDYVDMELHHIDKIYTSTFMYDKKTGLPIAKKPRSLHELVYALMKSVQAISGKIFNFDESNSHFANLLNKYSETIKTLEEKVSKQDTDIAELVKEFKSLNTRLQEFNKKLTEK